MIMMERDLPSGLRTLVSFEYDDGYDCPICGLRDHRGV